MTTKAGQIVFLHCRLERIIEGMQKLIQSYVIDLTGKGRLTQMEPNFEANTIKIRSTLASQYQWKLKNKEELPEIKIQEIILLRGLGVNRNENYSTDSYEKD